MKIKIEIFNNLDTIAKTAKTASLMYRYGTY